MDGYFQWSADNASEAVAAAAEFFKHNGYAVLRSFCTDAEVLNLRAEAANILEDFNKKTIETGNSEVSVFTTDDQTRVMDDNYFLSSSANVSCFLEQKQPSDTSKPIAVNKIGHALHDLNDVFAPFSRLPKVKAVAKGIGLQMPLLVQSMYILKNARVGGEVRPHRDASFVLSDAGADSPAGACLGYWWALEDATLANGCLWAVPGSHRDGVAFRTMVLDGAGKTKFVGDMESEGMYTDSDYVALPVAAGDLVVLHGALVHKSLENTSERSRHAYSIHVVDGKVPETCWLQRPSDLPFREL